MNNHTKFKEALQRSYNRTFFAKEVLVPVFGNLFEMSKVPIKADEGPSNSEKKVIKEAVIYGRINLEDGTEITCYEITLQPKVRIEYNKVAIQQYVRKMLISGSGALINFVSESAPDVWRLTLVARTDIFTKDGPKAKVTNSKRYTYLLGPSESCKTAAMRLVILSSSVNKDYEALLNAFSVEKLSKDFFNEYKDHYEKFVAYLGKPGIKKAVFNGDEKAIRDFTKKLLGRIVFLYFVQKKGWLGASNLEYKDGANDFLMQLYNKSGANEAFYQNWLTTLFFNTLNKERSNDNFTMPDGKKVKIPFLNGGLFDKEEYDADFLSFKPQLFHNPDNDEDPKYRGFLDFLNAFNFTVFEDSPEEHTVAVDPEMLGHIFENLLEDNKDKGAYYTPKEIVHYMTQESLIEYLAHHLCIDNNVYSKLGDNQTDLFGNEGRKQLLLMETESERGLNHSDIENIVRHKEINGLASDQLKKMNELLDRVKICDPAIGSGAFPMGLLHEIFSIKEVIANKLNLKWDPAEVKKNIIQKSIYGVDIEKGAVDIARLRFWLSLVVDEEKPRPLPNLDYKIIAGNSLVSLFEDEIIDIEWDYSKVIEKTRGIKTTLRNNFTELIKKHKEYFTCKANKNKLHDEIKTLKAEILISHLELSKIRLEEQYAKSEALFGQTPKQKKQHLEYQWKISDINSSISELNKIISNKNLELNYFDWKLDFPEVLNEQITDNTGFDIVIGNPPYIQLQKDGGKLADLYKDCGFKTFERMGDIYSLFYEKGVNLLKPGGHLCFITSNKWMRAGYGKSLRHYFITFNPKVLIDLGPGVFENATVDTNIFIMAKEANKKELFGVTVKQEANGSLLSDYVNKNKILLPHIDEDVWFVGSSAEQKLKEKIERIGKPLKDWDVKINYGIKTGLNEAFIIDNDTKKRLCKENSKSAEIIKPILKKDMIKAYLISFNNLYLINTHNGVKNKNIPPINVKKEYPNIYNFLSAQAKKIEKGFLQRRGGHSEKNNSFYERTDQGITPYNLRDCAYLEKFESPKIIWKQTSIEKTFTFDDSGYYLDVSGQMLTVNDDNVFILKYLLGLLHSKIVEYYIKRHASYFGREGIRWIPDIIYKIPIPPITSNNKTIVSQIENTADKILHFKKQGSQTDTRKLEKQIDLLVYKLYELTDEEIAIVEGNTNGK